MTSIGPTPHQKGEQQEEGAEKPLLWTPRSPIMASPLGKCCGGGGSTSTCCGPQGRISTCEQADIPRHAALDHVQSPCAHHAMPCTPLVTAADFRMHAIPASMQADVGHHNRCLVLSSILLTQVPETKRQIRECHCSYVFGSLFILSMVGPPSPPLTPHTGAFRLPFCPLSPGLP